MGYERHATRAIVCFIDDNEHLIQQALALRHSWLYADSLDTDMVAMGPPSVLARLPDDLVKIEQRAVASDPEWQSYHYGNATAYLNGVNAHRLDRYSHLLHTDVDTFITPAWHGFHPADFVCGIGRYVHDENTRLKIQQIAADFGFNHRGLVNTGSTWYGPTPLVRRVAAVSEMLTRYILSRYFREHEGAWPGWYRGVAQMYASEIAINHCAPEATRTEQLDGLSTSTASIRSQVHIHCWHTSQKFSKHDFMSRRYTEKDAGNLNLDIVADYAMEMSFRSLRDMSAKSSSAVSQEAGDASPTASLPVSTEDGPRLDADELVRMLLACSVKADSVTEAARFIAHSAPGAVGALPDAAEYHGVAPLLQGLVGSVAKLHPDMINDDVRRVFDALASRHRRASAARETCIDEILTAFAGAGVQIVLLKGAALAYLTYADPALRPTLDLDVLIEPTDLTRAVQIVSALGYEFDHGLRPAGHKHRYSHVTKLQSGFRISLEIHEDAIPPDLPDSITLATLTAPLRSLDRGARPPGLALGHTDMLRHLARHAFAPAGRVRLKHLYDLWRYQSVFGQDIDWPQLRSRFPQVAVALQLTSRVFADANPETTTPREAPDGEGLGMMPLSAIAGMPISQKLNSLFNPSPWWLHGFYGIPAGDSLLFCRTVRHPLTVAGWLAKRLIAVAGPSRAMPSESASRLTGT